MLYSSQYLSVLRLYFIILLIIITTVININNIDAKNNLKITTVADHIKHKSSLIVVKKNDMDDEILINIYIYNNGYKYENKSNNGLTYLTIRAFQECDTLRWSRKQINDILHENKINMTFDYTPDNIIIRMSTHNSNHLLTLIPDIINEVLYNLHLDVDKINQIKDETIEHLPLLNSQYEIENILLKQVYNDHPYMLKKYGTKESIDNISILQIDSYITIMKNRGILNTVLIGNIKDSEGLEFFNKIGPTKWLGEDEYIINDLKLNEENKNFKTEEKNKAYFILPTCKPINALYYTKLVLLGLILSEIKDNEEYNNFITVNMENYVLGSFYIIEIDEYKKNKNIFENNLKQIINNIQNNKINIKKFLSIKQHIIDLFSYNILDNPYLLSDQIIMLNSHESYTNNIDNFISNISQVNTNDIQNIELLKNIYDVLLS